MENNIGQGPDLLDTRSRHPRDHAARRRYTDPRIPTTRIETFLNSLPAVSLTDLPEGSQDCPICVEPFQDTRGTEMPVQLPCKHIIGKNCLRKWLNSSVLNLKNNTCPFCRAVLLDQYRPPLGMESLEGDSPERRPLFMEATRLAVLHELEQLQSRYDMNEYNGMQELERIPEEHRLRNPRAERQERASRRRVAQRPTMTQYEASVGQSDRLTNLEQRRARVDAELETLQRANSSELERQTQVLARLREVRAIAQRRRNQRLNDRFTLLEESRVRFDQRERPAAEQLNFPDTSLPFTTQQPVASANNSESSTGLNGGVRSQQQARSASQRLDALQFTLPRLEARTRTTAGMNGSFAPREEPTAQQQSSPATSATHPRPQTKSHLPYTLPRLERLDTRSGEGLRARYTQEADPLTGIDQQQAMPPAYQPNRTSTMRQPPIGTPRTGTASTPRQPPIGTPRTRTTSTPRQPPVGTPRSGTRAHTARHGTLNLNERIIALDDTLTILENEHRELAADLDRIENNRYFGANMRNEQVPAPADRVSGLSNIEGGTARLGESLAPAPADHSQLLVDIETRMARLRDGLARAAEQQRAVTGTISAIARARRRE